MYYTLYKITNVVNGKIYIGVHITDNLDDDYMGSGLLITRAIKKYGKDKFYKEYLEFFDNSEDMYNMESQLVNSDFVESKKTYNILEGGKGFTSASSIRANKRLTDKMENDPDFKKKLLKSRRDGYNAWLENPVNREFILEHLKDLRNKWLSGCWSNNWLGRKHKEETKCKIGEKNSISQKGIRNSQYGTMWITNGLENKKIKKTDLIPDGWVNGRKILPQ